MQFPWKPFQIDLNSFYTYVSSNVSSSDGIVATEDYFEVVESTPFTPEESSLVQDYYDSLEESSESLKLSRPESLSIAIETLKQGLLVKDLTTLTVTERKVLLNLPLTTDEEGDLLGV